MTPDLAQPVAAWLARFEQALRAPGEAQLRALFREDAHWRDVLALSWDIRTQSGAHALLEDVRKMVQDAKQKEGFTLRQPGVAR